MASRAQTDGAEVFGTCPLPRSQYDHVLLGHGSGGLLTNDLIRGLFVPGFGSPVLAALEDQATLRLDGPRIAFLSVREGIEFETVLESDTAPLAGLTRVMLAACPGIRCMRDPTRGGLSSALNELADASRVGVRLEEEAIPLRPEVRGACEM